MASIYDNFKTGNQQSIPLQANGAVDINALIGKMVDRGIWTYYSTVKFPQGAAVGTSYAFFNAALGQPDPYPNAGTPVLTKVETNMPNSGQQGFSPPRDLILNQLGFYFRPGARLYDMQQVCLWSYFEFKIIDKIFHEGFMELHPPGIGIYGASTISPESSWTIGITNPHAVQNFNQFAKYIPPLMNFSLTLYFPETVPTLLTTGQGAPQAPAGTPLGTWLTAFMKGLTDRAVQ